MSDQPHEIMAFVKFEHQVFVVSLNPDDGHEQWIKVLSGLAPCPVEIVLMGDKTAAERSQGIAIVDHNSFVQALKIVDSAREQNEVLRVVLHKVDAPSPVMTPGSSKQHIPLSRICQNSPKKSPESSAAVIPKPVSAFRLVGTPDAQRQMEEKSGEIAQSNAPQWAEQMKMELRSLIDARFQDLNNNLDEKLLLLGAQMKESMTFSQQSCGSLVSSVPSESCSSVMSAFSPTSSTALPAGNPDMNESCSLSSHSSRLDDWVKLSEQLNEFQTSTLPPRPIEESLEQPLVDEAVSEDAESVVLVSQCESSNIELEGDVNTVGGQSDSVELVSSEHLQQADDVVSVDGSVVYVDTDGEDEEDAFSNLRSWAADGALTASQTTSSKMADSFNCNESMQSSFHSTVSDRLNTTPLNQETIVYKSWPETDDTTPTPTSATVDNHHEVESVFVGGVAEGPSTADVGRPVPINGSSQLPINLNAMKSIDEQHLFSPNSDIGTMLLSAASSIANGFLQSMESLSKSLSEYEKTRRLSQQHTSAPSSVAPSESSRVDLEMEYVPAAVVQAVDTEIQPAPSAAPEVPPRGRGPRGPPPSDGPYMTREQLTWYCNEYGVPDMIKEPWVNDRLTVRDFEAHIVAHFDRLE